MAFKNFYFENHDAYKKMWKNIGACALHAAYLKLQTQTHNMFIPCNNGCKDAPECHSTRTLPVMLLKLFSRRSLFVAVYPITHECQQ